MIDMSKVTCADYLAMPPDKSRTFSAWMSGYFTGLPIPARAEIVIEGYVHPDRKVIEGPFGEWSGHYAGGAKRSGLVFKGAVPAELGIYQVQGIDLVVNLRSAKSLGIEVPQGIIDRANALIK